MHNLQSIRLLTSKNQTNLQIVQFLLEIYEGFWPIVFQPKAEKHTSMSVIASAGALELPNRRSKAFFSAPAFGRLRKKCLGYSFGSFYNDKFYHLLWAETDILLYFS